MCPPPTHPHTFIFTYVCTFVCLCQISGYAEYVLLCDRKTSMCRHTCAPCVQTHMRTMCAGVGSSVIVCVEVCLYILYMYGCLYPQYVCFLTGIELVCGAQVYLHRCDSGNNVSGHVYVIVCLHGNSDYIIYIHTHAYMHTYVRTYVQTYIHIHAGDCQASGGEAQEHQFWRLVHLCKRKETVWVILFHTKCTHNMHICVCMFA